VSWDDDWRDAKREREQEDYERWSAQREAEHDADVGRYHRPTFSQEAWETYDNVWQDRDSYNRVWDESRQREDTSRGRHDNDIGNDTYFADSDETEYTSRIPTFVPSGSAVRADSSSRPSVDDAWVILGTTAVLMLIAVANLGTVGILACVFGWEVFLFFGWAIGSLIHRLFFR
jgi:hypothetical protein